MLFEKEGVARVDFTDPKVTRQVQILLKSFERSVGRKMLPDMPQGLTQEEQARYMFLEAPFIISHDRVQLDDGTFDNNYNFANLSALDFFEISYDALTKTPSSSTTETVSDEQVGIPLSNQENTIPPLDPSSFRLLVKVTLSWTAYNIPL